MNRPTSASPAVTLPTLREVWQVPASGPCRDDSDDEDCDSASGSNVELDAAEVSRNSSTAAARAAGPSTPDESSTTLSTTPQPAPSPLLTIQLPPREASVFLDELEQDRPRENAVPYDGGSGFSASLGMNIGLIAGIAAGIIVLTLVLAYAVCKYQGGRIRRLGGVARRGKGPPTVKDPGVTVETGLLTGAVTDHDVRKMTTTPLLYRDPTSNYASQKAANGFEGDVRRKRKDVNEWYV